MRHTFIEVVRHKCPRGRVVQIFFVPTLPAPNDYVVVLKQDGVHMAQTDPISKEAAYDAAELQTEIPGVNGDTSWRAVLARLTGRREEQTPAQWTGSNAEFASRFPIGTWAWLEALLWHRTMQSRGLKAA